MPVLPLQRLRQERRAAGASEASDAGTPGEQPRRQAQTAALLVPPWQPAELPGDKEGDGEEDDAAESHDDGQQADRDLCRRQEETDRVKAGHPTGRWEEKTTQM